MKQLSEPKEYGHLITRRGKIVNVSRIRMFEHHEHEWSHQLRNGGLLFVSTDQTEHYQSNHSYNIHSYDEVWFEGVCVYKKSLLRKLWQLLVGE